MSGNGGLRIGIFVFDGAEELDVVGPFEVFAEWGSHSEELRPTVSTFSWDGSGVRLALCHPSSQCSPSARPSSPATASAVARSSAG